MSKKKSMSLAAMKEAAEALYINKVSIEEIAIKFDRTPRTIRNWRDNGNWDAERIDIRELDKRIERAKKRAMIRTLDLFEADPSSVELKDLTRMLREDSKNTDPRQYTEDTLLKYSELTVDFLIAEAPEDFRKWFQANLPELCEYIKGRLK